MDERESNIAERFNCSPGQFKRNEQGELVYEPSENNQQTEITAGQFVRSKNGELQYIPNN
ncbi:hypothetical protein P886_4175 [Alteromonadaceae bacterium 2753L.S.0a.02]|nr:hypothetical protein P886_4175 [Alteromonadaceae bacterium 2753L.S.0a.02]